MADDDLRALERAARKLPGDLAAGRAWARALARADDPRAHEELVRLARRGDPGAEDEVAAWNPWPSGQGGALRGRGSALRSLGPGRRVDVGRDVHLVGVGRHHVFVVEPGGVLVARGLDDLEVRWRRGPCGHPNVVLAGDLVVTVDERRLLAWDAATGEDVAEARLPGPIRSVVPVPVARAVVVADARVHCVDLRRDAFGEVAWRRRGPNAVVAAGGPWVLVNTADAELLSVETGEPAWCLSGWTLPRLLGADAAGALASSGRGLLALDPAAKAERWRFEHTSAPDPRRLAFDERTVVAAFSGRGGPEAPSELVALARDTGAVRWRRPLDLRLTMALLPDGLYLGRARRVGQKELQPWVTLVDPLDGTVRDEQALPLASLLSGPDVAPLPGGLLALIDGVLWRFEERQAKAEGDAAAAPTATPAPRTKPPRKGAKKRKLARRPDPKA